MAKKRRTAFTPFEQLGADTTAKGADKKASMFRSRGFVVAVRVPGGPGNLSKKLWKIMGYRRW